MSLIIVIIIFIIIIMVVHTFVLYVLAHRLARTDRKNRQIPKISTLNVIKFWVLRPWIRVNLCSMKTHRLEPERLNFLSTLHSSLSEGEFSHRKSGSLSTRKDNYSRVALPRRFNSSTVGCSIAFFSSGGHLVSLARVTSRPAPAGE